MKFTQKTNLFFVIIVLALSNPFPAKASQASISNLAHRFCLIKEKTLTSNAKIKPEELENQISPVIADIQKVPNIHEHLINQLMEITIEITQQEKDEAKKLREELNSLHFTAMTPEEVALLPYEVKEQTILSLTFDSVTTIFDGIGEKIFSSKNPFKIPENTNKISQLDMFFLLGITLTMQDGNPIRDELHTSLMSCVGLKNVIKIQGRLHKPEIDVFIPKSMMSKFFNTRNPLRVAAIVKHVMNLTSTYSN
jgi:hypothetical protein